MKTSVFIVHLVKSQVDYTYIPKYTNFFSNSYIIFKLINSTIRELPLNTKKW